MFIIIIIIKTFENSTLLARPNPNECLRLGVVVRGDGVDPLLRFFDRLDEEVGRDRYRICPRTSAANSVPHHR